MIFHPTPVAGAALIDLELREDERGFFSRAWCQREFEEHGIPMAIAQINTSYSRRRGTLRGLHYQAEPHGEAKLIRCIRGAIYDVVADLRPDSPTLRRWYGAELTADNRSMLYVPAGCAHGFLTLTDDSEVVYQVSEFYAPAAEGGVRYDDPAFGIDWPIAVAVISTKDAGWPDFSARPSAGPHGQAAVGAAQVREELS